MKCCINHGIPEQCLHEINNTKAVSSHNKTHRIVKIVNSHQCLKYTTIMKECKKNCIKNNLNERKTLEKVLDEIGNIKLGNT